MVDHATVIRANIATISTLDPVSFPNLTLLFKHTSLRLHLVQYLTYMLEHPYPVEVDQSGRGYWSIPISYMRSMHGGTAETWQSHTVFLVLMNLLGRIRPNSRSILPAFKEAYHKASEAGRRPSSFFFIDEYTPEALAFAEWQAIRYREAGISVSHLTKTEIIRMEGQECADLIYMDFREVSHEEQEIREWILEVIADQTSRHGYTTPDAVEAAIYHNLRDDERRLYDKLMYHKKALCTAVGCEYRPPRKDDKERFALNSAGWIIVAK